MAVQLIITESSGWRRVLAIRQGESISFGRGAGNQVVLNDSDVSRRHCTIRWDESGIVVEDHGSRNGTFVNGRRVRSRRVVRGDSEVVIGRCNIAVVPMERVKSAGLGAFAACSIAAAFLVAGVFFGIHREKISHHVGINSASAEQSAPNVISDPPGAMVSLNNEYIGVTPVKLTAEPGRYSLRLTLSGYQPHSQAIQINGETGDISIKLAPMGEATLEIKSEPPDAEVLIDGTLAGRTPLTVSAPPGTREIILQKPNYITWRSSVDAEPGQTVVISQQLDHRMIRTYRSQLEENPNDLSAWCQLGHLYILERRHEEARDALTNGMDVFCKGRDTSGYAGRMKWLFEKIYFGDYFVVGTPEEHKEMQEYILDLYGNKINEYPNQQQLRPWLEAILNRAGRRDEMERIIAGGKLQPNLDIYYQAADIYVEREHHQRAVSVLARAINIGPEVVEAHRRLGEVYLAWHAKGNAEALESAIAAFNKALELTEKNEEAQEQRKQIEALIAQAAKLQQNPQQEEQ